MTRFTVIDEPTGATTSARPVLVVAATVYVPLGGEVSSNSSGRRPPPRPVPADGFAAVTVTPQRSRRAHLSGDLNEASEDRAKLL